MYCALRAHSRRRRHVALLALRHPAVRDAGLARQEWRLRPAHRPRVTGGAVAVAVEASIVARAILVWLLVIGVAACRGRDEAVHAADEPRRVLPDRGKGVRTMAQLVALQVGAELAVDLHVEDAIEVVTVVYAAKTLRVLSALPGDILLHEPVANVTRRVSGVLVPETGDVRRGEAKQRQLAWRPRITNRHVVESATVIAKVLADLIGCPGGVARRHHDRQRKPRGCEGQQWPCPKLGHGARRWMPAAAANPPVAVVGSL
mmetsp:Transcript_69894/g.198082  ORF Transcript_69894/g.198082 Transcript_69894/m.198082 type:complete len:260 (+) Transcript_69894:708-1487(+)